MNRQITIRELSNAVSYFNSLLLQKVEMKAFQSSVNTIDAFLLDAAMSESCPMPLLENIFTILVSKYYQIFTQSHRIIAEQYLQNQFANMIKILYQRHMDKSKLSKNIFALCLAANINKLKQEIAQNPKNNDTTITLLNFNLVLLGDIIKRNDFKIKEFYPKLISLCSNGIRRENLSLRAFELILETMKVLISVNGCFSNNIQNDQSFRQESYKRLSDDLQYMTNRHTTLEVSFRAKLKSFAQFLLESYQPSQQSQQAQIYNLQAFIQKINENDSNNLKMRLFTSIILFAQINSISINLQSYSFLQKETILQSYKSLSTSTCSKLMKAEVNLQLKKQEFAKLIYLINFVELTEQDSDEASRQFRSLVKHIFYIRKNHCLITIPHHACTVPLQQLGPSHTRQNYPTKYIDVEYQKEFWRMMTQIIPFYELETQLVETIQHLFAGLTNSSRFCLLRMLSDQLVECEYQLDMSLTKLYNYLSLLLSLRFVIVTAPASFQWYNLAYLIFQILASKSESVKTLKASYIEEELLISTTIEIISHIHRYLKRFYTSQPTIQNKIKLTQSTILLTEKILNSLAEESYLIRLITTDSLLTFAEEKMLSHSLQNIQAALIHRNKNNLQLMLNILAITELNLADYEELAEFYMNHRDSEMILRVLLPKISIERCRMCLLTVEKWWVLFTKAVIIHLNGKEMKTNDQKSEHFYVKDGENVAIKNALGVIILEMSQKWIFYLRSPKKQVIIDIILEMSRANPNMVFFRSFFTKIMKELINIVKQCLGYEQEPLNITCKKKKTPEKQRKTINLPQKVEFYDRMRLKIYQILVNLPKDSYAIFDKDVKDSLKSILQPQHDLIKKEYLFDSKLELKGEYELGKQLLDVLE